MYGGGINDNVAPQILMQRSQKQLVLAAVLPLLHQIAEIWTMKAGNVLVGTTEPELRDNVVPHLPRCARRKGRNRQVREMLAQRAKLTILRAKLVPHSEMQCASSMAKKEIGTCFNHSIVSLRARRSGERYSNRKCPCVASRTVFACSLAASALFRVAAGIPIWGSCAIWSCISAINGEITTPVFSSTIAAGN